jgi:predicted molibdopterin-dependent oxidoreductase YjgC
MKIFINNKEAEVIPDEPLIETARREGFAIPSLCYAKNAKHKSSCMVCAVKDCKTEQIIPSCTTFPVEGMTIDTECEEVMQTRTLSLELLLSDHRADCEAPCSMVCPAGLDIERMLGYYDAKCDTEAIALLSSAFSLLEVACNTCKAPCEKVCRRGTIDSPVSIRKIINELANRDKGTPIAVNISKNTAKDKNLFQSRLGRFTDKEKDNLKTNVDTHSHCLHCACSGKEKCLLRLHATQAGIKHSRYKASSVLTVEKTRINGDLWFEPAKCIRCGLCVYNSDNGFTFKDRGFNMKVVLPEGNAADIPITIAVLCPTGAIYKDNKL